MSKTVSTDVDSKSSFVRNVLTLVTGSVGAQLLLVLASPVLTRIYSPEDFGVLGVYLAVVAIVGVVAGGRYELAIPIPDKTEESLQLVAASFIFCTLVSIATALVLFFFSNQLSVFTGNQQLQTFYYLIPFGVFVFVFFNILYYWSIRKKQYKMIASAKIIQSITTLICQIVLFPFGYFSLIIGNLVGYASSIFTLFPQFITEIKSIRFSKIETWEAIRKYKQFPIYSTWSALLSTAGRQLPPVLFASFFGISAAGFYVLAHRVLALPITVIGNAIGSVFFSDAADAFRNNELQDLVFKVFSVLIGLALPPTILLTIFAPDLFSIVFGSEWRAAGEYASWMAVWLAAQFCFAPISTTFTALKKENIGLVLQFVLFISRVGALTYGYYYLDLMDTVKTYALTSALIYILFLTFILLSVGVAIKSMLVKAGRTLFQSILVCVPFIVFYEVESVITRVILVLIGSCLLSIYYFKVFKVIQKF
jgi:O-antigen/teichoic acid export membrane protein